MGKTSLIQWLAKASGNLCVRINNHEHTDIQEYLGCYTSDENGKLVFKEGRGLIICSLSCLSCLVLFCPVLSCFHFFSIHLNFLFFFSLPVRFLLSLFLSLVSCLSHLLPLSLFALVPSFLVFCFCFLLILLCLPLFLSLLILSLLSSISFVWSCDSLQLLHF